MVSSLTGRLKGRREYTCFSSGPSDDSLLVRSLGLRVAILAPVLPRTHTRPARRAEGLRDSIPGARTSVGMRCALAIVHLATTGFGSGSRMGAHPPSIASETNLQKDTEVRARGQAFDGYQGRRESEWCGGIITESRRLYPRLASREDRHSSCPFPANQNAAWAWPNIRFHSMTHKTQLPRHLDLDSTGGDGGLARVVHLQTRGSP